MTNITHTKETLQEKQTRFFALDKKTVLDQAEKITLIGGLIFLVSALGGMLLFHQPVTAVFSLAMSGYILLGTSVFIVLGRMLHREEA